MREQLLQKSRDIDKRLGVDKRIAALIASVAALTTVNAAVVAAKFDKDGISSRSIEQANNAQYERLRLAAVHEAAQKRARASYINGLVSKVPAATYAAALLTSPRDLVKAEHRIIAMGLPPVPVSNAINLAKPFKITYSEVQKKEAATVVERWIDLAQANKVKLNFNRSTGNIFKTLTPEQESSARSRIANVMDNEMARNVREVPAGSNIGPRIDYYLGYHITKPAQPIGQKWCAAYASTVYMLSGIPFNGGHKYSRNTPDYLLTRAAEPDNPAESPRIPSVSDWFKENAYHFKSGDRNPGVGDAVFMRRYTSQGKPYWHVGLVRNVTRNGSLITHEGNAGNALVERVYPNYRQNDYIQSFGSLFPSEQKPQSVPKSPIVEMLKEPLATPTKLPVAPELLPPAVENKK